MRGFTAFFLLLFIGCGGDEFASDATTSAAVGGTAGSAQDSAGGGAGASGNADGGSAGNGDAGAGAGSGGDAGSGGAGEGGGQGGAAGDGGTAGQGAGGGQNLGPLYVFVSSETHNGKFGDTINTGLKGADSWCKQLADKATAPGVVLKGKTWRAWLSRGGTDAKDRIQPSSGSLPEYVLVDGTTVFPAGFTFGNGNIPENALNVDEKGESVPSSIAWTGTVLDGTYWQGGDCTGWSSDKKTDGSLVGKTASPQTWSHDNTATCDQEFRVYCFEIPGP